MNYFYILCSELKEIYYYGSSDNPQRRLDYHNHEQKGFTQRFRPWKIVFTQRFESRQKAEATEKDSIQNYQGNFISVGNEAVLKGENFVYQVKMDSMTNILKETLKNYQLNDQNIIPVEVKGKVTDNKVRTGYSKVIEIKEIVEIFASKESENTEIKK